MKKRLITLLLLSFAFTSCGGSASTSGTSSQSSTSTTSSMSTTSSIPTSSTTSSTTSSSTTTSSTTTSSEVKYVVTFDSCGGSDHNSMVYSNSPLILPTPVYYHHDFLGWYDNSTYQGSPVNKEAYIPTSDVTLFAKWDEVLYLYIYEGGEGDYSRSSYHIGDELDIDALPTPKNAIFNGTSCPFTHYTYDGTDVVASGKVTFSDKDICLVCNYDKSKVAAKSFLEEVEPGVYLSKGNLNTNLYNGDSDKCYFEMDISFIKGRTGGAGIIHHSLVSSKDYIYEAGCSYLTAVIGCNNGAMSIQSLANGTYTGLASVSLNSMPAKFKADWEETETDLYMNVHLSLRSESNSFKVYVNNELAYSCSDIASLCTSKGVSYDYSSNTFMGIRSSCSQTYFRNVSYIDSVKNIHIQKDSSVVDYQYLGGEIPSFKADEENYGYMNVAFDQARTDIFDYTRGKEIVEGMTLYATNKRMFWNPNVVSLGENQYKVTGNAAGLIGVSSSSSYTIEMAVQVKKANASVGATGIICHATMDSDNTFEADSKYIMVQLSGNGSLQVASNDHGTFAHFTGSDYVGNKTLATLPKSWSDAYNAAEIGDLVDATIKVVVTETQVTIYINGEQVGYTNNATRVQGFSGLGYGVRVNNAQVGQTFSYNVL